jgi:hypothetical protein
MHAYIEAQNRPPAVAGARRGAFELVVYGVVNPEPDADAMATVLIRVAREQLRKQQQDQEDGRSRR